MFAMHRYWGRETVNIVYVNLSIHLLVRRNFDFPFTVCLKQKNDGQLRWLVFEPCAYIVNVNLNVSDVFDAIPFPYEVEN